jgi:hypothetical protein
MSKNTDIDTGFGGKTPVFDKFGFAVFQLP